jgi:predicted flap endonuclease-1-like 5' DNA nuclease
MSRNANQDTASCQTGCLALAGAIGLFVFGICLLVLSMGWLASIFFGALWAAVMAVLLPWLFCKPLVSFGESQADAALKAYEAAHPAPAAAPAAVVAAAPSPAPVATEPVAAAYAAAPAAAHAAAERAEPAAPIEVAPAVPAATSGTEAPRGPAVQPSAFLAGQAELAAKKGEWKYVAPAASAASATLAAATPAAAASAAAGAGQAETAASAAAQPLMSGVPSARPAGLDSALGGKADDLKLINGVGPKLEGMLHGMGVFHFYQIADWGNSELAWVDENLEGFYGRASRDEWIPQARILSEHGTLEGTKYTVEGPRVVPTPRPGSASGAGAARKPQGLTAARGGKADDLKIIKGIGPKLEKLCHSLGFYHFDQIAAWTDTEIAWVDDNLEGFKGRVTRDEWVPQAKILAGGGTLAGTKWE